MAFEPGNEPEVVMSTLPETHSTGETPSLLPYRLGTTSTHYPVSAPRAHNHPFYMNGRGATVKDHTRTQHGRLPFGLQCTTFAFVVVILYLALCVIGLAAGVGIITHKYEHTNSKLKDAEFAISVSNVTNGCSGNKDLTHGTYTSNYDGYPVYTMYCNKNILPTPISSLFARTFNNCMEACSLWNMWREEHEYSIPRCQAVSFAPFWSNINIAADNNWEGDCFLKASPMSRANLSTPDTGSECHSAIAE